MSFSARLVLLLAATFFAASVCLLLVQARFGVFDRSFSITPLPIERPLTIEVVDTEVKRALGLSGRTDIPENYGMLFVFPHEARHGFWMKGMLESIDMLWISKEGEIVHIESNVSPTTYPDVFYPVQPALYVLEMKAGEVVRLHFFLHEDISELLRTSISVSQ